MFYKKIIKIIVVLWWSMSASSRRKPKLSKKSRKLSKVHFQRFSKQAINLKPKALNRVSTLFLVKNEYALSFLGSLVSGFVTACVSLPVDMAKTRTQNMKVKISF